MATVLNNGFPEYFNRDPTAQEEYFLFRALRRCQMSPEENREWEDKVISILKEKQEGSNSRVQGASSASHSFNEEEARIALREKTCRRPEDCIREFTDHLDRVDELGQMLLLQKTADVWKKEHSRALIAREETLASKNPQFYLEDLTDPKYQAFVIKAALEEMKVAETERLIEVLQQFKKKRDAQLLELANFLFNGFEVACDSFAHFMRLVEQKGIENVTDQEIQNAIDGLIGLTVQASELTDAASAKLSDRFHRYIGRFDEKEWYKLYIDRNAWLWRTDWSDGPPHLLFDRSSIIGSGYSEKGYFAAMTKAFRYVEATLGEPINFELFDHLHSICTDQVDGMSGGAKISGGKRYNLHFMRHISPRAKQEWETEHLIFVPTPVDERFTPSLGRRDEYLSELQIEGTHKIPSFNMLYVLQRQDPEVLKAKVERLCETYHQAISVAGEDKDAKLRAIANLCRGLEILHVYSDGNQRTIAFALLTKLLLENGFCPAIVADPFMFDGFMSTQSMVEEINIGMQVYIKQCGYI